MKLTILKIGARWCGPCNALARARTLEKFAEKHPDIRVEIHDDTDAGNARWEEFADRWKVKALPTLIWLYKGEEVLRSSDVSARGVAEQYERALKKAERP